MTGIEIHTGDITKLKVNAIVNAANERLAPGGGVCGAIHRAAGPELARECAKVGPCPTGDARVTKGYDLPAKWVIHAVGPVWHGGEAAGPIGSRPEDQLLASCYRHSLELAEQHGLRSVAFPSISTGAYGFPMPRAARIAIEEIQRFLKQSRTVEKVVVVCFGQPAYATHVATLQELAP
jgi:O-acetyl-ADP-ribose deacetylase (regulator of RNase III)